MSQKNSIPFWFMSAVLAANYFAGYASARCPPFPARLVSGADATGGRGGSVYHVTNLDDAGPGSFRDAVSKPDRTVVFDVGGYVTLQSEVSVASNITIAGQTAPGDGIGFRGAEVSFTGSSNDICRYIRCRESDLDSHHGKSGINVGKASNIILDHCSVQFAQWDDIDAVNGENITIQNCLIADPILQQFAIHSETENLTVAYNLFVNVHNRIPLAKKDTQYVNNVIYNFQAGYTNGNSGGKSRHDIVNNYFITGPATTDAGKAFFQLNANASVYALGNFEDKNDDGVLNGEAISPDKATPSLSRGRARQPPLPKCPHSRRSITSSPTPAYRFIATPSMRGMSRRSNRSASRARIRFTSIKRRTALPMADSARSPAAKPRSTQIRTAFPMTGNHAHKLNPNDATDAAKIDPATGYSFLEEYLNSIAPEPALTGRAVGLRKAVDSSKEIFVPKLTVENVGSFEVPAGKALSCWRWKKMRRSISFMPAAELRLRHLPRAIRQRRAGANDRSGENGLADFARPTRHAGPAFSCQINAITT